MLLTPSRMRYNYAISAEELERIKDYLQGAVRAWIRDRPNKTFTTRDLVGGANRDWNGTPPQCLYNRHIARRNNHQYAMKQAAIDLGWILKTVLQDDPRTFESCNAGRTRGYKWIGNEP